MNSPLAASVAGFILFGCCSLFFFHIGVFVFARELAIFLGACAAFLCALAVHTIAMLVRHEGWAIVVTDNALELPIAPYRSRKRERIPLSSIAFVGVTPDPPAEPAVVTIALKSGQMRWIRQEQLLSGTVKEIALLLIRSVSAFNGGGRIVHMELR